MITNQLSPLMYSLLVMVIAFNNPVNGNCPDENETPMPTSALSSVMPFSSSPMPSPSQLLSDKDSNS